MEPNDNRKLGTTIGIVAAVLVAGGIGAYALMNKDAELEPTDTNNTDTNSPAPAPTSNTNSTGGNTPVPAPTPNTGAQSTYRDGTYSAVGNYVSPGGPEQVGVKLTLKDDIVTDATFTKMAERPMSVQMQTNFEGGYRAFVVGKDIDTINLTKVSGSSLTPKGFNDALTKIKAQAQIQAS